MSRTFYDNTRVATYRDCPREYYLRHLRGWRRDGTAMPLVFGSCWHAGMDGLWSTMAAGGSVEEATNEAYQGFCDKWEEELGTSVSQISMLDQTMLKARTPGNAKEMFYNYARQRERMFRDPSFKLIECEQPFAVPLYPNNADIWYIGRMDKVFQYNGDGIIGEHKTTSEYKIEGGFKTSWVDSWSPSSQIDGYLYAGNMLYDKKIRYVWVDGALVHAKVHDAFKFIPIATSLENLSEWLVETRGWIEEIEANTMALDFGTPIAQAFKRNTNNCMGKYGPCSFKEVCRFYNDPTKLADPPAGYIVEFWEPFDVLGLSKIMDKE